MPSDLFGDFERMRRDMDELFVDAFGRRVARRQGAFSPAVDVFYAGDPPRAIVRAELAGIDPDGIALEVRGRELILSGRREPEAGADRVYQQLEIEHGPFRRAVELGVEVQADAATATYDEGLLRIELPVARPERRARTVPIERGREGSGS